MLCFILLYSGHVINVAAQLKSLIMLITVNPVLASTFEKQPPVHNGHISEVPYLTY